MFTCLPKNLLKMVLLQTGHGDGSISQMSDCQRRHFPNFKILQSECTHLSLPLFDIQCVTSLINIYNSCQSESQLTLAQSVVIEYDQVTTCYPFNGDIIEKSDVFYISPLKCARFQCIANDQQVSDRSQIWQQQQKLANSAQL